MERWNLIVDVAECHNCHNCVVASKDELVDNHFEGYSAPHPAQGQGVLRIERHLRGSGHHVDAAYLPRMCQHCSDAPCVKAGRGAVKQRDDGIVIFDPVACKGRRDLVDACPYGAVVWNEQQQLPQTWFFDAHLLDAGWREPRAVSVCPTRALQAVKLDDAAMAVRAAAEGLQPLHAELGTRPRVHYRNLQRVFSLFVAGSVVAARPGAAHGMEAVEGAQVELLQGERVVLRGASDAFGDFRLDGLAPGSGTHQLRIAHAALGRAERSVELTAESVVLGDIALTTA
jgi:Fe-S-cluster-containing dehydrogenase component